MKEISFSYSKSSSEFRFLIWAIAILVLLIEIPIVSMLLFLLIKNAAGKIIVVALTIIIFLLVAYVLSAAIITKHSIINNTLVIRFGTKFKETINFSNIRSIRPVQEAGQSGWLFDVKYIPEQALLRVATSNKNLILIELLEPQLIRKSFGRTVKVDKILINVDEPERFLKSSENLLIPQKSSENLQKKSPIDKIDKITNLFKPMTSSSRPDDKHAYTVLKARNLSKVFGCFKAVNNINLTVHESEIFGFLGPNGAGKTTTINMLVGLLLPSKGEIEIFGHDIWKEPAKVKKQIGYVPDISLLYDRLTPKEFLRFTAELYCCNKNYLEQKINELLEAFNLSDVSDELIKSFSQGMKRKTAIAAAMIHSPKLLILDEPTNGLDPKGVWTVKNILKSISKKGTTILMSTHILGVAEDICDRIAIINKGEIIAEGSIDDIRKIKHMDNSDLEELFIALTE